MLKALSKIFNPKNLGDSLISGVDKSILTKEEKIDYFQKMLVLYEPFKLAQRILAIMFSFCFLLIHLATSMVHFFYILKEKSTDKITSIYELNNDNLGTIVLIIISFYFAGGLLEGTVNKFKKGN